MEHEFRRRGVGFLVQHTEPNHEISQAAGDDMCEATAICECGVHQNIVLLVLTSAKITTYIFQILRFNRCSTCVEAHWLRLHRT